MTIPLWQYAITMPIYIVALLFIVDLMRKHCKFAALLWILTLLTFPLWFSQLDGWFRWVKTFSVLIPTALVVGLARIANYEKREGWWSFFRKDWVLWTLYGVLGPYQPCASCAISGLLLLPKKQGDQTGAPAG